MSADRNHADLRVEYRLTAELHANPRNARTHSDAQIRQIADSIRQFGFSNPVLVDETDQVLAGHGRLEAARLLGLEQVPTIRLSDMSEAEKRAYVIADNRIAEQAGWDRDLLALELNYLSELDIDLDVTITGFAMAEVDVLIEGIGHEGDPIDEFPGSPADEPVVTRLGDLFELGGHHLLCADATQAESYARLLGGQKAQIVFTDPPYNVPMAGHASGLGAVTHREFPMASGEMTTGDFTAFLCSVFGNVVTYAVDGAIAFVFMDWRHIGEVLAAGSGTFSELKNLVVWAKTNAGMGTLYRSQHELIFVFKVGTGPHINNVQLGKHGRYRSNLWTYAGANTFRSGREDDLAMHPTVKPVALVAEALMDCSRRKGIVLDPFGGAGTTLIAAEKTGRRGYLMELDAGYVDVTIRRWERLTGSNARHCASGLTFTELTAVRMNGPASPPAISQEVRHE